MRRLAQIKVLLRTLFHRRQLEQELDEELADHLAQETESNIRAGMPPEEAQLAARRLIGSITLYKEESCDAWGTAFLESCARDLRYAFATLRRTPLFTTAAILTLALGIGANTTVFTFVENILLRPLPVRDPQQLVFLNWGDAVNMSYPNYVDFRDRNRTFSSLIAVRYDQITISIEPRDNTLTFGYETSGNYFQALGIQSERGRFFTPAEDNTPGAHPVLVISDHLWKSRFHAAPNTVGRTIKLNGYPFTIVGIAPPSFRGTELIMTGDFWVPMSMELELEPGNDWYHSRLAGNIWVIGRLKPHVSRTQAEADLNRIAAELARIYPDQINPRNQFQITPPGLIGNALRKPLTSFGLILTVIAALALLLACINLVGMLLARASDRHREIGIRLALGAGKLRLLRQLMTESLVLPITGGLLGFLFALVACRLFSSWHPSPDIPFTTTLHPNSAVLSFTALIALTTTLLFGLTPALQAVRTGIVPSLKDEPLSPRLRRWTLRDLLVAAQIALSVILVISSALVVRSLQNALKLNLGFNPNGIVSASFDLRLKDYTAAHSRQFDAQLLQRVRTLPGIQSAGIIDNLPLRIDHGNNNIVSRTDRPIPKPGERLGAVIYNMSPGYLQTMQTRLLAGRDVNRFDHLHSPPVALINEALAQRLFGTENPLGRHVRLSLNPADKGAEIVGIVETGKYQSLGEDPYPAVFLPIAQTGTGWTTVVVRTVLPTAAAVNLLRKTILDLNPELAVTNTGSLNDQLALPLFPARAAALVLGVFGALAMALAATGLFALMAYSVSRRTREIGIRMALGARPTQIINAIFQRTLILCAIGIVTGTATALAAGKLLSAILYNVSPRDPAAYAIALTLIIAVALLAASGPTRRAVRIDPARTLREQ